MSAAGGGGVSARFRMALGEVDRIVEAEGMDEVLSGILDLDERGEVQHSALDVFRHDAPRAPHRNLARRAQIRQLLPFLVLDEAGPVADVEIESRHGPSPLDRA